MMVFPQRLIAKVLSSCEERETKGVFTLRDAVAYFEGALVSMSIVGYREQDPFSAFQDWVNQYFRLSGGLHWAEVFAREIRPSAKAVRRFCEIVRAFQSEGVEVAMAKDAAPSGSSGGPVALRGTSGFGMVAFPERLFLELQNSCKRPGMRSGAIDKPTQFREVLLQLEGCFAGGAVFVPEFAELERDFQHWVTARYGKPDSMNWRVLLVEELSECEARFDTLSRLVTEYQQAATGVSLDPREYDKLIKTKLFGIK